MPSRQCLPLFVCAGLYNEEGRHATLENRSQVFRSKSDIAVIWFTRESFLWLPASSLFTIPMSS
jgi:hypothetical protein